MHRFKSILIVILLFTLITRIWSQNQNTNSSTQSSDWKTLVTDDFEIKHPVNWDADQSGQAGTSFLLFSPIANATDQFRENVNLLIQDLTAHNLTLDQYVELSEKQVETLINNGNLIFSERENDERGEYHKVIYSGKQGLFDLQFEQYFWVLENKAYILTLTCEQDQFDTYQKTGEEILDSFRFLEN